MAYMDHLYFSRRPAPDGLFGQRRFRLPPAPVSPTEAASLERPLPPRPLSPAELFRVARAWRQRDDEPSVRVALALESVAARRAPPPDTTPPETAAEPKSVVRKISEFMRL